MKLLDLFSGIGGFSLAARWASIETIQFVENDKYCQKVLNKNFPGVSIHGNIKTFTGQPGAASIISGGFPCQPFSLAGQRRGTEDDRALWPEMHRIIAEVKPAWVVGENVAGIIGMELDNVLFDLEGEDYETQAFIIPACAVGAPHRRDRVWIVARDANGGNGNKRTEREDVPNAEREQRDTGIRKAGTVGETSSNKFGRCSRQWEAEPKVDRVAHGIPSRVDRLKGLGNAIVPQVAYEVFKYITEIEKQIK